MYYYAVHLRKDPYHRGFNPDSEGEFEHITLAIHSSKWKYKDGGKHLFHTLYEDRFINSRQYI